ncbi:MAG: DHA2 family efflux MFS transporter permease subunit [Gammaproteobacteria bacterium]|nr:DHA2 family efflux MFS transporter permease subunit [Gammaproteobacteria bacterium]
MSATAASAAPAARPTVSPWLIAPVVAMAAFMEVLDISIANVSLAHIAGSLSASADEASWVLTSYLVTNAIVMPMSGWLSTRFGRKRFFLGCIAGFTASSLACGFAPNLAALVLLRAIQGATGGGLQPSGQAIMSDSFPPHQRGMSMALYGIAVVFAPAIGPTLGGWITDNFSWRWVFLINVPVGVIVFSLIAALVQDPPELARAKAALAERGNRIDTIGFGFIALGLGCLQIVLDRGQEDDWLASGFIVAMASISAASLIALVFWELRQRDPMVDLWLLKNRNFAVACFLMLMLGFMLLGTTFMIPAFVQSLLGYTATDAGLVITPGGFAIMLLMPVVGRMINHVDLRLLIGIGMAISGVSLFFMAGFNLEVDYHTIMLTRVLQAAGLAFLFIPINTAAFLGVPPERSSYASALINLARNLGGSIGISVVSTLIVRRSQYHQSVLIDRANGFDPRYAHLLDGLRRAYTGSGQFLHAPREALAAVYQVVQRQAALLSYLDVFHVFGLLFLGLLPLLILVRKVDFRRGAAPTLAH